MTGQGSISLLYSSECPRRIADETPARIPGLDREVEFLSSRLDLRREARVNHT